MIPEAERNLARRFMRANFIGEVESFENATGVARMRLQPDSRRYDEAERGSITLYVDEYLRIGITLGTMVADALDGGPNYIVQPSIESMIDYADARSVALANELSTGEYGPHMECPCGKHDIASSWNERGAGYRMN